MQKSAALVVLGTLCLLTSVLVRGVHQSSNSRYNYPDLEESHKQNQPSSKYDFSWLFENKDQSSKNDIDPYPSTSSSCGILQTFSGSIPKGRTKVTFLDSTTFDPNKPLRDEECVQECCKKEQCQYAWVFAEKCFLVGCSPEQSERCEPYSLEDTSGGYSSTYYRVQHSRGHTDSSTEPPTTLAPTSQAPIEHTQPSLQPDTTVRAPPATTAPVTSAEESTKDHGIIVATDGDTDITLPTNKAKLYGNTWPKPGDTGDYLYKWEKVSGPQQGTIVGKDDQNVELQDLVPGVYTLRLRVTDWRSGEWGETLNNITVHPTTHVNSPPVPIILPSTYSEITLPQDSIVLDAQSSTDDRGTDGLRFHWEEVAGPLGTDLQSDSSLLRLSGLTKGLHQYKLTVTDVDGATAVATAKVNVLAEQDYPPVAHAGNPVVLHLPSNEATLDGSLSKDEGELKYKWTYLSGPGGGDMEGANTVRLHVKNLILGNHQYQLEVTDSSGQTSTDTVSVIVTAEMNTPPIASAGGNKTVVFPDSQALLNGQHSSDDYLISSYHWTQLSGPTDVTLQDVNNISLTVSGLHIDKTIGSPTLYTFQLTVTDYGNLTDSDIAYVVFRKDPKIPPVAFAGVNVNITLPQSAVILDGSGSHDDFGITSYKWERSMDSPAAGLVVGGSDRRATLILSDLVNGTYHFTLTVTNNNGLSAEDTVTLRILPNPSDKNLLQVHLEGDITQFTEVDLERFKRALRFLLFNGTEEQEIEVVRVSPAETHIMVEFFALGEKSKKILNTTEAYYKLTEKGQDYKYTSFHIVKVEMKVCQLPCSGHGTCNVNTKQCECSTFWTENPFKSKLGRKESNCDWSVFYVALVVLGVVALLLICVWICCCCCVRRRRRARSKRRIRYAILDNKGGDPEAMQMLPKDYRQTSLMVSESETEEEILFETPRKVLNNDTRKSNKLHSQVRNGKIITSEGKRGNQNSQSPNDNNE